MQDPLPENIEGTKRHVHSFEHSIEWGHVAAAAAVIVVVLAFGPPLARSATSEPEPGEGGTLTS